MFLKLVLKHALASKRITIMDRKEFIYSYLIIKLPRNYTIKCFKIFRYQYRQYFNPVPVTFLVNAIFYILLYFTLFSICGCEELEQLNKMSRYTRQDWRSIYILGLIGEKIEITPYNFSLPTKFRTKKTKKPPTFSLGNK